MKYLTPKQLKIAKQEVLKKRKQSYFVRENIAASVMSKHVGKNSKIIEVGGGDGGLTMQLLDKKYTDISLVDFDDYIPNKLKNHVKTYQLDVCMNNLPFNDNDIDAVVVIAVLEHLENPFYFVREVERVLKRGGKFIISIPHVFSIRGRIEFLLSGNLPSYYEHNNHVYIFTEAILKKMLSQFNIIEEIYTKGFIKIFHRKIRFSKENKWFDKNFGVQTLYVLEKK